MKIQFWSMGKAHEQYVKEGIEMFTKRITNYFPAEWKILSCKNAAILNVHELKRAEAALVLNSLQSDYVLITLDERGKQITSEGLAKFIQNKANHSAGDLVFLIGGAYGLDDSLLKQASFNWSLSSLVFPHQLVRLILAEQVYRACTIIRNEKYHHS